MEVQQSTATTRLTESWLGAKGSVYTRWILSGPEGAVAFLVRTGGTDGEALPMGIDAHHARPPLHYEHCAFRNDCEYTGGDCWSDGTGLGADELWRKLLATETDAAYPDMDLLWAELGAYYHEWLLEIDRG